MDKRFFIALVLTGVVVLLTPTLFPNKRVRVQRAAAVTDTLATAAGASGTTAATSSTSAPTTSIAPRNAPPAATAPAAVAVAATTHTLRNELATFEFSNYGARLTRVGLNRYERLGPDNGPAELVSVDAPLVALRLISGGDTIRLDQQAFAVQQTNDGLRYDAPVGTGTISVRYAIDTADYLVRTSVEATGLPQPSYLLVDLPTGFRSQEADTTEDFRHLAYAYNPEAGGAERVDFRKPDPGERLVFNTPLTWAVAKNKYFLVGVLAQGAQGSPFAELQVTGAIRANKVATRAHGTVIAPLPNGTIAFELYAGPQEWQRLVALGREFENTNPYGGWISGVVQPFATIVMRLLLWLKATLGWQYGWILVLFGVLVKVVLWPLNGKAMRSQMMIQRMQPELQEVQNKYKNDREKLNQAMMKVYADHGMSPLSPLAGCLPILLQMPILLALFFVFQNTIEFRGVSFLWLTDISLKDPYYIVPILMGASMFLMSWITMRNAPPNPQAKMMSYLMPPIFTLFLLNFAAGLNVYYTVSNLAGLPQQWLISKERAKITPPPAKK